MRQRAFGPTGRQIPVIGQGSWDIELSSRDDAVTALRAGIDSGMRHIDTAEMYGSGASERIVGEAIRGQRDNIFLVSKVLPSNASHRGVLQACERSLKALGTDRLDCYLLHWRGSVPLEETFGAFEALVQAGKILSYGVSNFDTDDLDEALALLGPGKLACNQVLYHLQERAIEHAVIPWCQHHDVAVVAYSPFGHGDFPESDSEAGQVLEGIAQAHGVTARQVALAFLTRLPGLFAIPKAARAEHARSNALGGALVLSDEDIASLDAAFPRGARPDYLPMI